MKKFICVFLMVFLLSSSSNVLSLKAAGTEVGVSIANPVWTEESSPYIVNDTVEILKGAKLTIEAGAVVQFGPKGKILVKGELAAIGNPENRIVFTSSEASPSRGDWLGIEFASDSVDAVFENGNYVKGSIIKFATIKYGQGIICDDASPYLAANDILNNDYGVKIIGELGPVGEKVELNSEYYSGVNVVPVYIENNDINDNKIGIIINKNNSRNYMVSVGGKSFIGDKIATAYVKGNTINNNEKGVIIENGDYNVLMNNEIEYNKTNGVFLEKGSDFNVLQKNSISNNNNKGINNSGSGNVSIISNTIKNNFGYGVFFEGSAEIIKNNNIYNNTGFDFVNETNGLDLSDNYWGTNQERDAKNKISDNAGGLIFSPIKTFLVDMFGVMKPVVNKVYSPVYETNQFLSGVKPINTAVYINGEAVILKNNETDWEYKVNLFVGENIFEIKYLNEDDVFSEKIEVKIERKEVIVVPVPTVDYQEKTGRGSMTLQGKKQSGSSIWINRGEVVAADDNEMWTYEMPLEIGENKIKIFAKDSAGRESEAKSISIIRTAIDIGAISAEEIALTTKVDNSLAKRLSGRLLMQVEKDGSIWYVNPEDNKRYYAGLVNALELFRKMALGISEENLSKIPNKTSSDLGDKGLRNRLKGRFLLRVEVGGKIVYVDFDGYRHDIEMENLMDIFRGLSLGVSNENIRKIGVGVN